MHNTHYQIRRLRRLVLILILPFAVTFNPATASAQLDWLKKGRELMGTETPSETTEASRSTLSRKEIAAGLKDALRVGSERVVGRLGSVDGFNADPEIHIPLPDNLDRVRSALQNVGMGGMMDDLELKLNRAAEHATPQARQLFLESIEAMTLDDVMRIYQGPEDAATRYFERRMSLPLAGEMHPLVARSLEEVGAIQVYSTVMGRYQEIPFVPDVQADLTGHVVDQAIEGIFYYLAREEAAIRTDPAKRTTDILQKVFGSR